MAFLFIVLGIVYTRGESLQDGLRDMQTCGMTLAVPFVCYIVIILDNRKKSKMEVSADLVCYH